MSRGDVRRPKGSMRATVTRDVAEWNAYLRSAEVDYYSAVDALRALGSNDEAILGPIPAALLRVKAARARYDERLVAYVAFREHHARH